MYLTVSLLGGEALYYRVDWSIVAHPDDAFNFMEYVAPRGVVRKENEKKTLKKWRENQ